jgi:hypothetical protein
MSIKIQSKNKNTIIKKVLDFYMLDNISIHSISSLVLVLQKIYQDVFNVQLFLKSKNNIVICKSNSFNLIFDFLKILDSLDKTENDAIYKSYLIENTNNDLTRVFSIELILHICSYLF